MILQRVSNAFRSFCFSKHAYIHNCSTAWCQRVWHMTVTGNSNVATTQWLRGKWPITLTLPIEAHLLPFNLCRHHTSCVALITQFFPCAAQIVSVLPLAAVHTLGNLLTNVSLGHVAVSFTHTIKARHAR